jgi:DNA-binding response OmpR family regulator
MNMSQAKILVVDDEQEIVRALTMRLRAAGYQVISANNGEAAVRLASKLSPDLVILDIGMPCGNGHAVARQLAENSETLDTPVIFLTARMSEEDRTRAFQAGAAAYLIKPFKPQDLLAAVARGLSGVKRLQHSHQAY